MENKISFLLSLFCFFVVWGNLRKKKSAKQTTHTSSGNTHRATQQSCSNTTYFLFLFLLKYYSNECLKTSLFNRWLKLSNFDIVLNCSIILFQFTSSSIAVFHNIHNNISGLSFLSTKKKTLNF